MAGNAYEKSGVQLVFDTNILVDAMTARGQYASYGVDLLELVRNRVIEGWYAPHTITTAYYLLEKTLRQDAKNRQQTVGTARALLKETLSFLKPLPQVGDELLTLDSDSGDDLEDLLIIRLATDYLPNPLFVTRDKWFLTMGAQNAAHPKEIITNGLDTYTQKDAGLAFIDLQAQQRTIRPQLTKNIHTVLNHGKYILGPEVHEFETRLADFVGVKHCIGVSSGTDALLISLMAQGVGPGDAIFTTPFTFIATAEVISLLGATPVFVDIDPKTYNIDPEQLKQALQAVKENDSSIYPLPHTSHLTPYTSLTPKGIVTVDLFGLPAYYDPIMAIANEEHLFVLEDAAQGLGGVYKGRQAGSLGHIGTTSFFPAKPLGCYGDGGAIFTDNDDLADTVRSIRVHGKGTHKYDNIRIGVNARLHTMQAAILLPKLEIFSNEINERQRVAKQYSNGLKDAKLNTPFVPDGLQSVWAQYSLVCDNREQIQNHLKSLGIPTAVYYGKSLHLQPAYKSLSYAVGDMPNSERISQHIFSLPMHPYLRGDEIARIVQAVLDVVG